MVARQVDIEQTIADIAAETEYLPRIAAQWDSAAAIQQADWDFEWESLMSRLATLSELRDAGAMSGKQEAQFISLLRKLREQLPLLRRLGFELPPVSLDTEAA